jgi:DNA transformation protein
MPVSSSYRIFVMDQLGRVVPGARARAMFGGVGIYAGDIFFALIADDTLYFKVDESTRADFTRRGMDPFRPYGPDGEEMGYYQVPGELIEDPDELRPWVEKAIAVARGKRRPRSRRRGT